MARKGMSALEAAILGGEASKQTTLIKMEIKKENYYLNPKLCESCNGSIAFEKKVNRFCSKNCAATYNNTKYPKRPAALLYHINGLKCRCGTPLKPYQIKFCSLKCHGEDVTACAEVRGFSEVTSARKLKKQLISIYDTVCMSETCAWDFSKQSVRVELDHIDGNSNNNTLCNLRLLCPNCHSNTPTYGSKNMGNGRYHRRKKALLMSYGILEEDI